MGRNRKKGKVGGREERKEGRVERQGWSEEGKKGGRKSGKVEKREEGKREKETEGGREGKRGRWEETGRKVGGRVERKKEGWKDRDGVRKGKREGGGKKKEGRKSERKEEKNKKKEGSRGGIQQILTSSGEPSFFVALHWRMELESRLVGWGENGDFALCHTHQATPTELLVKKFESHHWMEGRKEEKGRDDKREDGRKTTSLPYSQGCQTHWPDLACRMLRYCCGPLAACEDGSRGPASDTEMGPGPSGRYQQGRGTRGACSQCTCAQSCQKARTVKTKGVTRDEGPACGASVSENSLGRPCVALLSSIFSGRGLQSNSDEALNEIEFDIPALSVVVRLFKTMLSFYLSHLSATRPEVPNLSKSWTFPYHSHFGLLGVVRGAEENTGGCCIEAIAQVVSLRSHHVLNGVILETETYLPDLIHSPLCLQGQTQIRGREEGRRRSEIWGGETEGRGMLGELKVSVCAFSRLSLKVNQLEGGGNCIPNCAWTDRYGNILLSLIGYTWVGTSLPQAMLSSNLRSRPHLLFLGQLAGQKPGVEATLAAEYPKPPMIEHLHHQA
ncbi:Cylicin-2, partial [Ophiophagus hannah]